MQHRAVAAERDDEVEAVGEPVGLHAELGETGHRALRSCGTRTSTPCSRNHAAAERANSCAISRSRCGTSPTARTAGCSCRDTVRVGDDAGDVVGVDRRGPTLRAREELDVAVGAAQRRRRRARAHRARARRARRRPRAAPRRAPPASRTMPPLPSRARPASNCGFTSSTNSASGVVSASRLGATVRSEMNERSATQRSAGGSIAPGLELAHVGALHHRDARVVAQRPRELSAPDVDRDHVRGAPAEQAVGEPAGRRADVDRARAGDVDRRTRRARPRASSPPRETNDSPRRLVGDDDRFGGVDLAGRGRRRRCRSPRPGRRRSPRPPAPGSARGRAARSRRRAVVAPFSRLARPAPSRPSSRASSWPWSWSCRSSSQLSSPASSRPSSRRGFLAGRLLRGLLRGRLLGLGRLGRLLRRFGRRLPRRSAAALRLVVEVERNDAGEMQRLELALHLGAHDRAQLLAPAAAGLDDLVDRGTELVACELTLADQVGRDLLRLRAAHFGEIHAGLEHVLPVRRLGHRYLFRSRRGGDESGQSSASSGEYLRAA